MQAISLNNNMLIDLVKDKGAGIIEEVDADCSDFFKANIRAWEKQKGLTAGAIASLIKGRKAVLFVFDSLRLDLFLVLRELIRKSGILTQSEQAVLLTASPSDTITFRCRNRICFC